MTTTKPIPDGFHTVTPYMIIKGAAEAIEFYKKAFGAKELYKMADPDGKVRHAQIKIGNSPIMIADEYPEMSNMLGPHSRGGATTAMYLYVEDVDALAKRAIDAGIKVIMPVQDQFYGDRSGGFEDPYGHIWWIATHKEDVSHEEIQKRAAKFRK